MTFSTAERTSHVLRRLGMGGGGAMVDRFDSPSAAITAAFDMSGPPPVPPQLPEPVDLDAARDRSQLVGPIRWWLEQMATSRRLIEERLVWFLHDHFATSASKAPAYLVWQQHITIRRHAIGRFDDLLHAMAVDPAMLFWLDGVSNTGRRPNENFAREAMGLFTIGPAQFSQTDVAAAARACSGWTVNVPGRRGGAAAGPGWGSLFTPSRHDSSTKTVLGRTGAIDMTAFIEVLLDHPATVANLVTKLFVSLVGLPPDSATTDRLAAVLRHRWHLLDVAAAIAAEPQFLSEAAIRSRVRNPVEKAVTVAQAIGDGRVGAAAIPALRTSGYVPLFPPNVAGYPEGDRLLGPHQLIHALDLLGIADKAPLAVDARTRFRSFGVIDVSAASLAGVESARSPAEQTALVLTSPEVVLT